MNAAARALAEGSFAPASNRSFFLSSQMLGAILLFIAVLASGLAVVYVKDLNRHLFGDLQSLQQAHDELQVELGQLSLEVNTWAASARVQNIAEQQLKMSLPMTKDVVLVTLERPLTS